MACKRSAVRSRLAPPAFACFATMERGWLAELFSGIADWRAEAITQATQTVLAKYKLKLPRLAMPVRAMVFGLTQTPNLSSVLALAGKDRVLSRMRRYLAD